VGGKTGGEVGLENIDLCLGRKRGRKKAGGERNLENMGRWGQKSFKPSVSRKKRRALIGPNPTKTEKHPNKRRKIKGKPRARGRKEG